MLLFVPSNFKVVWHSFGLFCETTNIHKVLRSIILGNKFLIQFRSLLPICWRSLWKKNENKATRKNQSAHDGTYLSRYVLVLLCFPIQMPKWYYCSAAANDIILIWTFFFCMVCSLPLVLFYCSIGCVDLSILLFIFYAQIGWMFSMKYYVGYRSATDQRVRRKPRIQRAETKEEWQRMNCNGNERRLVVLEGRKDSSKEK